MISGFYTDAKGYAIVADVDSYLPYKMDLIKLGWLQNGDTISSAACTVETGATKGPVDHDDTTMTVFIGPFPGGEGEYTVTWSWTTAATYQDERSYRIIARER